MELIYALTALVMWDAIVIIGALARFFGIIAFVVIGWYFFVFLPNRNEVNELKKLGRYSEKLINVNDFDYDFHKKWYKRIKPVLLCLFLFFLIFLRSETFVKESLYLPGYYVLWACYLKLKDWNNFKAFVDNNRMKDCNYWLERYITHTPLCFYLKEYKLNALLLGGNIDECKWYYDKLLSAGELKRRWRLRSVDNTLILIGYLKNESGESTKPIRPRKRKEFADLAKIIQRKSDSKELSLLIPIAKNVGSSPNYFNKSVSALLLSDLYALMNDKAKSDEYFEIALKFSPSQEMAELINRHRETIAEN